MTTNSKVSRRNFISGGAAIGMASSIGLRAAENTALLSNRSDRTGDKVNVGFIGAGARAQQLMEAMEQLPGVEIVALCDAYRGRLERALERTGGRAKLYQDFRELISSPQVSAVFIATPDHHHKSHALAALGAGKDVYLEKPMTYTIEEGLEIVSAVKRSGRILQVGSQGISSPVQNKAREIIASGMLGQVTMVRATYNRNTAGGAWIYPIPPDASPQTVAWEVFLGQAPQRRFSPERFFRWRCYQDYSGGIATDLFVHTLTSIHFMMKAQRPESVVAFGSIDRWKEGRDVPDTLNAIVRYPQGFTVMLSSTLNNQAQSEESFQILGTQGTLQLNDDVLSFTPEQAIEDNSWVVDSWPRVLAEAYYKDPKVQRTEMPQKWPPQVIQGQERWREVGRSGTELHLENFFSAVKTRQSPVEDAVFGHYAAAVAHLINLAAKQKKVMEWDPSWSPGR